MAVLRSAPHAASAPIVPCETSAPSLTVRGPEMSTLISGTPSCHPSPPPLRSACLSSPGHTQSPGPLVTCKVELPHFCLVLFFLNNLATKRPEKAIHLGSTCNLLSNMLWEYHGDWGASSKAKESDVAATATGASRPRHCFSQHYAGGVPDGNGFQLP